MKKPGLTLLETVHQWHLVPGDITRPQISTNLYIISQRFPLNFVLTVLSFVFLAFTPSNDELKYALVVMTKVSLI